MVKRSWTHSFQRNKKALAFTSACLAPQEGLEPTTLRLTAECSAIELLRNIAETRFYPRFLLESGDDLSSRAVSSQVLSALKGLTPVFGMGTGGTPSSLPPEMVSYLITTKLQSRGRSLLTAYSVG